MFNEAALAIQRVWRGFFTRKILSYYLDMLENGEEGIEGYQEEGEQKE